MKAAPIHSILVSIQDPRDPALKQAAHLAKALNAHLRVADALAEPPAYRRIAVPNYAELAAIARDRKSKQLRSLQQRLKAQSIEADTVILPGPREAGLVQEVAGNRHSLVVLGAERGANDYPAGATGMYLLRKCPCPIWIVRPRRSRKPLRVLAAVSSPSGGESHADLNSAVLRLADSFCRAFGGQLHILHAWRAFGESLGAYSAFCRVENEKLERYLEETRRLHASELNELLNRCAPDLPARCVHLVKGDAPAVIEEFCRREKIDLLVMGTVARQGVSAVLVGNTAETVVNAVNCSVLAVRVPPRPGGDSEEALVPADSAALPNGAAGQAARPFLPPTA